MFASNDEAKRLVEALCGYRRLGRDRTESGHTEPGGVLGPPLSVQIGVFAQFPDDRRQEFFDLLLSLRRRQRR